MKELLADWRERIRRSRPKAGVSQPSLYSQVGAEVVQLCREAVAEGMTWGQLERALGVSATTLRKWQKNTPPRVRRSGVGTPKLNRALLPVRVATVEARPMGEVNSLALIGPSGFRLEGLNPTLAVQMMRELA